MTPYRKHNVSELRLIDMITYKETLTRAETVVVQHLRRKRLTHPLSSSNIQWIKEIHEKYFNPIEQEADCDF